MAKKKCPRCGGLKNRQSYCKICASKIVREWRVANGHPPKPNFGKGLCPCGKPRHVSSTGRVDKAYCRQCKEKYNERYRAMH